MCRRCREKTRRPAPGGWRGLTLLELLLAISIMVIIAGALGALAKTVELSSEYGEGHGEVTQHARVVLERMTRTVNEAAANERFSGFLVVPQRVGMWPFPDTLVVWHPPRIATNPKGLPRNPEGLPCYDELVIYCPDPASPNQFLEITLPNDTRTVPAAHDEAAWASELALIKTSTTACKVVLTGLLRTGLLPEARPALRLGMVRFASRLRPSQEQWDKYQQGDLTWDQLPWAQGMYGSRTGLRQAWLRIELQMMPGETAAANDPGGQQAIPFFGSAAVYYHLQKAN